MTHNTSADVASLPANHVRLRELCHVVSARGPKNWPEDVLYELRKELEVALTKPASEDGLPELHEPTPTILLNMLREMREEYGRDPNRLTVEHSALDWAIRRLAISEQPGSTVQGEVIGYINHWAAEQLRSNGYVSTHIYKNPNVITGDGKPPMPLYTNTPPPAPAAEQGERKVAPWPDYAGNPIHEGDTIRHPTDGTTGVVFVLANETNDHDRWRVLYNGDASAGVAARLCLQIDYKGRAVVIPPARAAEQGEALPLSQAFVDRVTSESEGHRLMLDALLHEMLNSDADEAHPYVKALQFFTAPPPAAEQPGDVARLHDLASEMETSAGHKVLPSGWRAACRLFSERLRAILSKQPGSSVQGVAVECVTCDGDGIDPEPRVEVTCCGRPNLHGDCCGKPEPEHVPQPCRQCGGSGKVIPVAQVFTTPPPAPAAEQGERSDALEYAEEEAELEGNATQPEGNEEWKLVPTTANQTVIQCITTQLGCDEHSAQSFWNKLLYWCADAPESVRVEQPEGNEEWKQAILSKLREALGTDGTVYRAVEAMLAAAPAAPGVRVDEATQDAIDSILNKLHGWSKAYPADIFHEPTKEECYWLHATRPGLMDRIAASMGRHISGMIAADLANLTAALATDDGDAARWRSFRKTISIHADGMTPERWDKREDDFMADYADAYDPAALAPDGGVEGRRLIYMDRALEVVAKFCGATSSMTRWIAEDFAALDPAAPGVRVDEAMANRFMMFFNCEAESTTGTRLYVTERANVLNALTAALASDGGEGE